jgi:hypothetical protein
MRTTLNLVSLLGLIVAVIVSAVGSIYLQATNPDMTDMRLFLTYWKFYGGTFAAFFVLWLTFKITE